MFQDNLTKFIKKFLKIKRAKKFLLLRFFEFGYFYWPLYLKSGCLKDYFSPRIAYYLKHGPPLHRSSLGIDNLLVLNRVRN